MMNQYRFKNTTQKNDENLIKLILIIYVLENKLSFSRIN
jgi:hypothetical protein